MLAHFAERSNEKELNAEITLLDTFSSIQPPQPLKIVLHHKTYAVSLAHSTIHIFARSVQILQRHTAVVGHLTEDISEDVGTALILILGIETVVTLHAHRRVTTSYPQT